MEFKFKPVEPKMNHRYARAQVFLGPELYGRLVAHSGKLNCSAAKLAQQMVDHCLAEMEKDER